MIKIRLPFRGDSANTIYADPPWPNYGGGMVARGANHHYDLMNLDEIEAMAPEIDRISGDNCHLYLWTTAPHLDRAFNVVTWVKNSIGLGQYFRGQTEFCLFAVKGRFPYKSGTGLRSRSCTSNVVFAKKRKHSQKPNKMYKVIESVSYPPYVELFARNKRKGWLSWGHEVGDTVGREKQVRK